MIDDRLHELIDRWEIARESGETVSIDDLCTDCPELRDELDSMIRRLSAFETFTKAENHDDEKPFDAGRYRVLNRVAAGGIGEIFIAQDSELRRDVALKLLQSRWLRNPENRIRFELEAEITGRLEHPGIVPVYGFGKDADGSPYYAMRYVRGETLESAIETFHKNATDYESTEFQKLLRSFLAVCQTIAYAHSRQVIHRDIKPANIMLGSFGEVLVLDWGLAKPVSPHDQKNETAALQPTAAENIEHTVAGSTKGSPIYMSPEQARGDADGIGEASDVYSLGATFYFLLTGQRPFSGHNLGEYLEKVRQGQFDTPRAICAQIPLALEAVCLKAMRNQTKDRYESAAELAADVERFLADKPVNAWREPFAERIRRWVKNHRTLVISTTAALLMAVVGLTILGYQETRANSLLSDKNDELKEAVIAERQSRTLADVNAAEAGRQTIEAMKQKDNAVRASAAHSIALADRYFAEGSLDRSLVAMKKCPESNRSPEWHLLDRMHHAAARTVPVGGRTAVAIAMSHRKQLVAVANSEGDVTLFDVKTWTRTIRIPKHWIQKDKGKTSIARDVRCLALSNDGTALAIGCADGRIELWDVSKKNAAKITDNYRLKRSLNSVTISLTKETIVLLATDVDGHATAWEFPSKGAKPVEYNGFQEQVQRDLYRWSKSQVLPIAGTITRDGRLAVTVGGNELRIWETKTGRDVTFYHPLQLDDFPAALTTDLIRLTAVAVSDDMQKLIVGDETGTIRLYYMDLAKAKGTRNERNGPFLFKAHKGAVKSLAFSPDGKQFLSCGADRRITVCDTSFQKRILRTVYSHVDSASAAAFLSDGLQYVSIGSTRIDARGELTEQSGELKVWNRNEGQGFTSLPFPILTVTPDGRQALMSSRKGLHLVDTESGQRVATIPTPLPKSPKTKKKRIFSKMLLPVAAHEAVINSEGTLLAILQENKILTTHWPVTKAKSVWSEFPLPKGFRRGLESSLSISPNGKWIALLPRPTQGNNTPSAVICLDVNSRQVFELKLPDWKPASIMFSPDSSRIIAGGHNKQGVGRAVLWRLDNRQVVTDFDGWNLATISPDGKRLALADGHSSDVAKIEIRELATGKIISNGRLVIRNPADLRFSPDGRRLIIWSHGYNTFNPGSVAILDTSTGQRLIDLPEISDKVVDVMLIPATKGFRLITRLGLETRVWSLSPRIRKNLE